MALCRYRSYLISLSFPVEKIFKSPDQDLESWNAEGKQKLCIHERFSKREKHGISSLYVVWIFLNFIDTHITFCSLDSKFPPCLRVKTQLACSSSVSQILSILDL